jgi:SAM-dependent methyltransferase
MTAFGNRIPWSGHLNRWLRRQNYDVAVRYRPIAQHIRRADPDRRWHVLDVGSGCGGLAPFLPRFHVVGIDMVVGQGAGFPLVRGSALAIPFPDQSWDVVACVDVIEHLAPEDRAQAMGEILRVARRLAILAFPFGEGARQADRKMAAAYASVGRPLPGWLTEHLQHPHPELDAMLATLRTVAPALSSRNIQCHLNEPLGLQGVHRYLARTSIPAYKAFSVLCSAMLPWLPGPRAASQAYRVAMVVELKR